MSQALAISEPVLLPLLIDRASLALSNARSAAEILEAKDMASLAYDAAKKVARLAKAKKAHDELVGAAYRAQADAMEIEARAKRRMADEYDAAQERGEIKSNGGDRTVPLPNSEDIGLSRKDIHESRIIRDAEIAEPGIVRRALEEAMDAGGEPTRAHVMRAALKASKRKRTRGPRFQPLEETQHDRDLRMLLGVWEATCESARKEFLSIIEEN